MNEQQERERFEAWVTDNGEWPQAAERNNDGTYRLMHTVNSWAAWLARASQDHEEDNRDMVNTVPSDAAFRIFVENRLRPFGILHPAVKQTWDAALQYAAEQKSERDRTVDTIISAAMADISGENAYDFQYCTERKSSAFNKIRKIWNGKNDASN